MMEGKDLWFYLCQLKPASLDTFLKSEAYEIGADRQSGNPTPHPPHSHRHLHGQSCLMWVISQHTKAPLTISLWYSAHNGVSMGNHLTTLCVRGKAAQTGKENGRPPSKKEKKRKKKRKKLLNETKLVLSKDEKSLLGFHGVFALLYMSTRGHCSRIVSTPCLQKITVDAFFMFLFYTSKI